VYCTNHLIVWHISTDARLTDAVVEKARQLCGLFNRDIDRDIMARFD
jgi:hypothetical protein